MEEVGAQVAPPVAIHQRFCNTHPIAKKRGLPFHSSSIGHQNPSDNWNPKSWDWDSSRFVATPAQQSDGVRAGNPSGTDQSGKGDKNVQLNVGDGAGAGNGGLNLVEETQSVQRPNKRVRAGSPGGTSHHPMCQVDDCEEDLSRAKDYHRRHKVCEVHSKASKASVGKQMQRFCQQCSRFHPLPEFDEGKRSCRRRLAGHNRRRRKTQPEETTTPRVLHPDSPQKNFDCDANVIKLLAVLAHAQGSTVDKSGKLSTMTPEKEKDNLMQQLLSKINLLPLPGHLESTPPFPKTMSPIVSNQARSEKSENQMSEKASAPSTMDLLAVLSATPSDAETQSQPSNEPSDSEKTKSTAHIDQTTSYHFPMEETDTSPSLQLQLFSSSPEDSSVRRFPLGGNYVSSNSSNPSEERSSPVSSPLVHNLFPMRTSRETTKDARLSNSEEEIAYAKPGVSNGCSTSLQLFGGSIKVNENGSIQSSPHRAGYTSSSGSDHSPSSLNSDAQERTDRIIFKLFDKDPSHLPASLRNQIYNWLSNSPSEMESYIRPGCIVLSLYLSMSSFAWNKLEENFLSHVKSLVIDTDDFWRNGRFLVYTDRKMASHKDGTIRLCKSRRDLIIPELISVSPVAIVAGQETSLLLRGRNLTAPSTTIHCTHADGYSIEKVSSSCQAPGQDEISLSSFKIREAASNMYGRCFIEVENRFKGTAFPVIIADDTICQELRLLEPEINGAANQETLYFLNELGWLFQRKSNSSLFGIPNYKLYRFSFLLTFSIEHDFCALVKTLLDILSELNSRRKGLVNESLEMLSEVHLLNRAVRRRCRAMVDMLVKYSVIHSDSSSRKFIFSPDLAGPGGLTPLHLAACTSSSDDIIDALTNDPQATGMKSWNSALDANGLSPYAYASMRNNHSYNVLVARKLSDRKKGQISVAIEENEIKPFHVEINDEQGPKSSSCSRCAVAAARAYSRRFPPGLLQRPYIHSMLVVAAVCVCVCLLLRGRPNTPLNTPLVWENMGFGAE
ncbi:SBP domain [Castilleja foliolosa]|uniref:SBP domain n=1 Tax=Castilleja foliolosa TaxID=1961234 RepID=A0ABD3DFZ1_9LAMI